MTTGASDLDLGFFAGLTGASVDGAGAFCSGTISVEDLDLDFLTGFVGSTSDYLGASGSGITSF